MPEVKTNLKPNRLINEKSPYLLQHAHNPVDWYPWSNEAFEKAKKEDRPVFLSVGYSTCHWCHVMERESFEDEEVAALLNDHFVAIKVDREERPDIDHIYMAVCQAMTGQGGWPLTVIMTPDKKPFFAGTYFPKFSRYGQPGLMDILGQVEKQWRSNREGIASSGGRIVRAIQNHLRSEGPGHLEEDTVHEGYSALKKSFDPDYGGFGSAPKFPTPHNLGFLLRYWKWTGEDEALSMVEKTLQAMHDGGIYDHLGFGFSRYSTDRKWLVPHFEKMLYDNALLAMVYLEAYQVTGKEQYARVAREILRYVLRDMTSPEGAFYSAEDADSEGEEGKFYVWTPGEIKDILGPETGSLFCRLYGVTEKGNFEGRNILNRIDAQARAADMEEARRKLFLARERRPHPYKDDKVLTSWNGLMIAALAMGSRVLHESAYREAAIRAAEFIWVHLRDERGRLLARYRDGEAAHPGYIDDYAFLTWAMIELYQADLKPAWLRQALELQEEQNRLFWDREQGGFFFYGCDVEELLARPKEIYDGATPSGNSVSAHNLLRLARLTGRQELAAMADTMFQSFAGKVEDYPAGYTHFLTALLFSLVPGKEIVVVADYEAIGDDLQPLWSTFAPDTVFLYNLEEEEYKGLDAIAPFIRGMTSHEDKPTFYVCQNFACRRPTTDVTEVRTLLQ